MGTINPISSGQRNERARSASILLSHGSSGSGPSKSSYSSLARSIPAGRELRNSPAGSALRRSCSMMRRVRIRRSIAGPKRKAPVPSPWPGTGAGSAFRSSLSGSQAVALQTTVMPMLARRRRPDGRQGRRARHPRSMILCAERGCRAGPRWSRDDDRQSVASVRRLIVSVSRTSPRRRSGGSSGACRGGMANVSSTALIRFEVEVMDRTISSRSMLLPSACSSRLFSRTRLARSVGTACRDGHASISTRNRAAG